MNYQEFTGGELPDVDLVVKAKSPSDAATQLMEIRVRIREVALAGGLRAIDYEAASMPVQENPGVPTTPRALWVAELSMDVDRFFEAVLGRVTQANADLAPQTWRIWCMYRVQNSRWDADTIAAVEQLTPRTVRHRVSIVDQAVWDELEARDWRVT